MISNSTATAPATKSPPGPTAEVSPASVPRSAPSPAVQAAPRQTIMAQRREIKYLVDRTTRTALTRDLSALMRPDAYSERDGSYRVRSIYFDTPDYLAYHDKMAGLRSRYKLRIRTYGGGPETPSSVRFEVKARLLSNIHKFTADVPWQDYQQIELAMHRRVLPPPGLWAHNPDLKTFFRILRQYNMEPKVLIQYRRQAFERMELGRIRVNFDDELVATRNLDLPGALCGARRLLRSGHAVFEIKIDGFLPSWLHMLIAKFNLRDQSVSKYCHAVRSEGRFTAVERPGDPE